MFYRLLLYLLIFAAMNNIKNRAEEIVLPDLIYA